MGLINLKTKSEYLKTPWHLFKKLDDKRYMVITAPTNSSPSMVIQHSHPSTWNDSLEPCTRDEFESAANNLVDILKGGVES